jgi:energy-coupling factor transporter ATP-binding protein EcfA2
MTTNTNVAPINANTPSVTKKVSAKSLFPEANFENDFPVKFIGSSCEVAYPSGYVPQSEDLETLALWYTDEASEICLITGHTGTGKTELVHAFTSRVKAPFHLVQVHAELRAETIFERTDLVDGKQGVVTFRKISPLAQAYINGSIILFDEFDKMEPEFSAALHGLLEYKSIEIDGKFYPPHPDTRIVGTGNTGGCGTSSLYVSSKQIDTAVRRRASVIKTDYPTAQVEEKILEGNFPKLDPMLRSRMVDTANSLRTAFKDGNITMPFTTGHLVRWGKRMRTFGGNGSPSKSFNFIYGNVVDENEFDAVNDTAFAIWGDDFSKPLADIIKARKGKDVKKP